MDVMFFNARLTIIFVLFLKNVCPETLRTYRMENYCGQEISMILDSVYNGELVFSSDGMSNCTVTIESWYSVPYLQFYFEDFDVGSDDCLTDKLLMKDGESVYSPAISGLGPKLCGSDKPADSYRTYTRYLRIEYQTRRYYPRSVSFSIVFNSFDVGTCAAWETRCDNGHCIRDEMNCNGYNPCGDHSDCNLTVGSIVGIVIGSLAGLAILLAVSVVLICRHRRLKFRNVPPQGPVPTIATSYVNYAHPSQPGVIPSYINPWYSTGQQQALPDPPAYEYSSVPFMPQAQISSQSGK
ncbi:hypothetical protein ACJMK2_000279 [Sinanodonta woodiana]|uniref:CUB domain-containing protein n=1 Tax=Sinanodonta woodiana TaxID=1069815 RepID=A0ABD3XQK0_SINWO